MDELVIKIKGSLNRDLTRSEIQGQLDGLGTELSVNIGKADQKQLDGLASQIKQLQNDIAKGAKSTIIFDEGKTNKNAKEIQLQIDDIIKKYQQLGTITTKKIFDADTGNIKGFNIEIEKANGLVEKLRYQLSRTQESEKGFTDKFI